MTCVGLLSCRVFPTAALSSAFVSRYNQPSVHIKSFLVVSDPVPVYQVESIS